MSRTHLRRRTRRLALTLVLVMLAGALPLSGCGSGASSAKGASGGAASAAALPAETRAFGFDVKATRAGVSPNATLTPAALAWFPPDSTDGLRPLLDQQELRELTQVAMVSPQFWILPSSDSTAPITFGEVARTHVDDSGEFTAGTVVPVVPLLRAPRAGTSLSFDWMFGTPTGYQVYLEGPAGVTSFGMTPGARPGTWVMDSRGELLNWPKTISALNRKAGFVATHGAITHTAFAVQGKRALYLTWAVFPDARGQVVAAALRDLPPTGDAWKLAGDSLHSGAIYPLASIFSTVTATPGHQ